MHALAFREDPLEVLLGSAEAVHPLVLVHTVVVLEVPAWLNACDSTQVALGAQGFERRLGVPLERTETK